MGGKGWRGRVWDTGVLLWGRDSTRGWREREMKIRVKKGETIGQRCCLYARPLILARPYLSRWRERGGEGDDERSFSNRFITFPQLLLVIRTPSILSVFLRGNQET